MKEWLKTSREELKHLAQGTKIKKEEDGGKRSFGVIFADNIGFYNGTIENLENSEEATANATYYAYAQEGGLYYVASKSIYYCDGKAVYYTADKEEADNFAAKINDARVHAYSDEAKIYPVDYGYVIVVTTPYND